MSTVVKTFGLTFAALLACAHFADLQGDAYSRPLSMFRDYEPAWIGYALFAVLIGIGAETVRTAFRIHNEGQAAVYILATVLLTVVAATPSYSEVHTWCALVAMAVMFVNLAVLLYVGDALFWFVIHLLTPSIMMMATRLDSYGIWQKGMILYFLAATVIHQGLMAQWLPRRPDRRRRKVKVKVGLRRVA